LVVILQIRAQESEEAIKTDPPSSVTTTKTMMSRYYLRADFRFHHEIISQVFLILTAYRALLFLKAGLLAIYPSGFVLEHRDYRSFRSR
jgi:hypothetical protein